MPVTKAVMAPGSFQVDLTSDALPVPHSLTDALRLEDYAFGHILVFPTRLDPNDYADADLFDLSVFTGIYRLQSNRTTLRGMHASGWLGDPNEKGALYETTITANTTLAAWAAALKPASLYAGTYGSPGYNLDWSVQYQTPRKALDYVADHFDYEWQVTDDLLLNVDDPDNIYGAGADVIATPSFDGRDVRYTAIRSTFDVDETAEEYTTRAISIDTGGTAYTADAVAVYKDGRGNDVIWRREVSATQDNTAASANNLTTSEIVKWGGVIQNLGCSTDTFCVMQDVPCGAYIYTYDPEKGIYDLGREVHYAGEIMFPMKRRVMSVTMQLRDGMGVVFRDMNAVYTDLSDHVAWETGSSRFEVGSPIPALASALGRPGVRA